MLADQILRFPDIKAATGLSRTTIWRLVRSGNFPVPLKITHHAVGWRRSEVVEWLSTRKSIMNSQPSRTDGGDGV